MQVNDTVEVRGCGLEKQLAVIREVQSCGAIVRLDDLSCVYLSWQCIKELQNEEGAVKC